MSMKKNIKLWAILIAIAIQSMTTLSVADSIPVSLQHEDPPLIGNNPRPSRGPEIPLGVIYDDVLQELVIEDMTRGEYTYYIFNENEGLESQGVLGFQNSSIQTIDLGLFDSGTTAVILEALSRSSTDAWYSSGTCGRRHGAFDERLPL